MNWFFIYLIFLNLSTLSIFLLNSSYPNTCFLCKIKCFVHEFHDNFRFCGIVNTNIEQLFNYFMRNRNMQSHFFTFIGHLYISLQFSFILRWTLSQTRHHSTALLFTGELQVEQRYVWITVFLSILTTFAFTFFWKVEALS